jgi:hypothetical protein
MLVVVLHKVHDNQTKHLQPENPTQRQVFDGDHSSDLIAPARTKQDTRIRYESDMSDFSHISGESDDE